jgi:hypothetical protein
VRSRSNSEDGQASVELVALLPLLVVVGLIGWQVVVAGQAVWMSAAAARSAARASAVGGDPTAAARRVLPGALRHAVRVRAGSDGDVRVAIGVPSVVGGLRLGSVTARAQFVPQRGG